MKKDIILSGVGGQGILSIATVIGKAALKEGLYMKQAEVHGMSQRGGSVVTYVRYGDKVYSPIYDKGQADVIISVEKLEAARYMNYLKKGGKIVVSDQEIDPMPVITGAAEYPENLIEKMKAAGADIDDMDALSLAMEAGSPKAVNIVLMGRVSRYFPEISEEAWLASLEACVPPKFLEMNKKAFMLGRN